LRGSVVSVNRRLASISYPRVDLRVNDIDHQVDDHNDEGGHEDVELDEVDVEDVHGADGRRADTRPREDVLYYHGTAEKEGDDQARDSYGGEEGGAKRMAVEHDPFGEA